MNIFLKTILDSLFLIFIGGEGAILEWRRGAKDSGGIIKINNCCEETRNIYWLGTKIRVFIRCPICNKAI